MFIKELEKELKVNPNNKPISFESKSSARRSKRGTKLGHTLFMRPNRSNVSFHGDSSSSSEPERKIEEEEEAPTDNDGVINV